jgi:hypothetical protein
MPLQLSVGLTKKKGLPDYGSIGASCNVTVELDNSLLHEDLESFHRHVKNAYVACSQSVNDELARQRQHEANGDSQKTPQTTTPSRTPSAENGTDNRVAGNGSNGHQASQKQIEYVNQLARQIRGLGVRRLETLADKMFSKPIAGLSSLEARSLIDSLKAIKEGSLSLDVVLNGAGA